MSGPESRQHSRRISCSSRMSADFWSEVSCVSDRVQSNLSATSYPTVVVAVINFVGRTFKSRHLTAVVVDPSLFWQIVRFRSTNGDASIVKERSLSLLK